MSTQDNARLARLEAVLEEQKQVNAHFLEVFQAMSESLAILHTFRKQVINAAN